MKLPWLVACLLAASVAAALGGAGAKSATLPSIYVDYGDDCVFAMRADGGIGLAAVRAPGPTIPPGAYQIVLSVPQNAPSCPLEFQLQGPGVQLRWDFGGEAIPAQAVEMLQPSSTYVATDLRNPARYRAVFTTAASGSSSSLVTQPAPVSGGKGESSQDLVGSRVLPSRGALTLTVGASGSPRLTAKGKTVRALRAGRYDLALVDGSSHAGLTVRKPKGDVLTLTTGRFSGKRSTPLTLRAGTWRFSSGRASVQVVVS